MEESKYHSLFRDLSKKPVFSALDARKAGIPSRMLAYFCFKEVIVRIDRGIYKVKDWNLDVDFEWEDLVTTAMSISNGVICLISALCYYNLTDQIMREFWFAVPHASTAPKRSNARIVRMRNITLGQTVICIGGQELKIFDRERTVVDAFRYLDQEIAIKALKAYLQTTAESKPDVKKLMKYAKALRVNITPYIMALTT